MTSNTNTDAMVAVRAVLMVPGEPDRLTVVYMPAAEAARIEARRSIRH